MCEGGWRAGLEGQMLCWGCGIAAAVAVRVTIPSLGHGGHSQSLVGLENIFHPLLVGCSQPWTGMR